MKKIFLAVAIAAIAGVNVYKANSAKAQVNDLSLNNVEQLAEGESGYGLQCKYRNGFCYYTDSRHFSYCAPWECGSVM